jgi:60 kDa SS-A/Ro ribonucleoprotein
VGDPLATISTRHTPQTEIADDRQVRNYAGGYAFTVDGKTRLRRFLVLGVDGGTYYASEREVTKDNAAVVLDWARSRGTELVDEVVAISTAGRAPRQKPALFALAAAASLADAEGRKAALGALPAVARTGTHLFLFARYVEQFRGWGRGLRRAVGDWYLARSVDDIAYQAVKYRQREGWTHRDLLRLAHPATDETSRKSLFNWICGRDNREVPAIVDAFENAQRATTVAGWLECIGSAPLSWEMLPDTALAEPAVWEALIDKGMPQTALMRQLPRLTRLGVLTQMSHTTSKVVAQLTDPERLRKARVHPVNVLIAARTYASGQSARGTGEWNPVAPIVDALDAAFYAAFGAVEAAGKRTMLALDVSGSMGTAISGLPLTCREASAALALVTAATEPAHIIVGFTSTGGGYGWSRDAALTPLAISPRRRLDDAIRAIANLPFGGTDCALPMQQATRDGLDIDTFVIYTDNETWAGEQHPHQALREYRQRSGIDARLVVVGMTATDFTIADPTDPGMLDITGFDSAVPTLIGDFSRRAI